MPGHACPAKHPGSLDAAAPALQQALAGKVAAIAARKGCTPAQLALAWLLAQGDDIIPIPGGQFTRFLHHGGPNSAGLAGCCCCPCA